MTTFLCRLEMPTNGSLCRPLGPLIIGHRFLATRIGSQQLQRPRAAARGQYPLVFRVKLEQSRRRLSSQTFSCLSPSYLCFSSPLSLSSPFLSPRFSLFLSGSELKSLLSGQESLQKAGGNLKLLDESERVPLCPSASGALSKFANCCWPRRGGRGRARVRFCWRCSEERR